MNLDVPEQRNSNTAVTRTLTSENQIGTDFTPLFLLFKFSSKLSLACFSLFLFTSFPVWDTVPYMCPLACVGFLQVFQVPPTVQKH